MEEAGEEWRSGAIGLGEWGVHKGELSEQLPVKLIWGSEGAAELREAARAGLVRLALPLGKSVGAEKARLRLRL